MQKFIEKDPLLFTKIRFLDLYMAGHKGFIAGGCFKNIFLGNPIKDVDVFFGSETEFTEADIYFNSNGDYVFSYENKNTKAYKNKKTNIRVELIRNSYGRPEDILKQFDFSVTKFAYFKTTIVKEATDILESDTTETAYRCLIHEDFFEHLTCRKLVLGKEILYPVSTFERSFRYTRYGFGLCRESKQHLLTAIKSANVDDVSNELYFGID